MPAATKYSKTWEIIPDFKNWLSQGPHDKKARCSWCNSVFSISHGGKNDVIKHKNTRNHQELKKLKLTTKPAIQCFGMCVFYILRCAENHMTLQSIIVSIFRSNRRQFTCCSEGGCTSVPYGAPQSIVQFDAMHISITSVRLW